MTLLSTIIHSVSSVVYPLASTTILYSPGSTKKLNSPVWPVVCGFICVHKLNTRLYIKGWEGARIKK